MPTVARARPTHAAASAADDESQPLSPALFWTAAVVAVVALVVSRRPDGITNPQFWAEDGSLWYAQAHRLGGMVALGQPAAGYLQSFSRLSAAASMLVDLRWAPLVMNLAATLAQSLAPLLLLSERFAHLIPDVRLRALAALLWIGAPNGFEIQSNVTNSQTHLAMLALLLVLATPPRSLAGRVTDVALLLLAGFSGPTCVLLVPVAALAWWSSRTPWRLVLLLVLLLPAAAQTLTYLTSDGRGRMTTELGATPLRLLQILGGQVFLGGTLGADGYRALRWLGAPWFTVGAALIGVAGLAFVGRALWVSGSVALRLFVLFAALELAAGLSSPAIDATPRWEGLRTPDAGIRYFAPPILAWLAVLLWSACRDPDARARLAARGALAAALLIGMPVDWRVEPRPDLGFAGQAARYEAAAPGTVVRIPIPPVGWSMRLVKR